MTYVVRWVVDVYYSGAHPPEQKFDTKQEALAAVSVALARSASWLNVTRREEPE